MWPLSRYQDFVDNTVPAITAAFLHAVQDAIGKVYSGTQTLKAMIIDGVGGSAATPPAGTIQITSDYGASGHAEGVLTLRMIPFAIVGFAGGASSGFTASSSDNVASCTRNSAGNYTVVTLTCPAAHAGLGDGTEIFTFAQVTPRFTGPFFCDVRVFKTTVAGTARLRAEVRTWDPGGSLTDAPFSLILGA